MYSIQLSSILAYIAFNINDMLIYYHGKRVLGLMLACIVAISFPFQGGEQASKRASEKLGGVR